MSIPRPKDCLKSTLKLLEQALSRDGIQIGTSHGYALLSAAFGIWAHELSRQYDIPFDIYLTATEIERGVGGSEFEPQFHRSYLIDKVAKLLKTDEWRSQLIASQVIGVIRQAGLRINMLRVLFDEASAEHRSEIFKALRDKDFRPINASVAIAGGELPALPASTIREQIDLLNSKPTGLNERSLADFIAKHTPCYLWRFPSPQFTDARIALQDRFSENGSAIIGMGFVLLSPFKWRVNNTRFAEGCTVICPIFSSPRPLADNDQRRWSPQAMSQAARGRVMYPPELSFLINGGVESLPKLKVCPCCLAIYSDSEPELMRACNCVTEEHAQEKRKLH